MPRRGRPFSWGISRNGCGVDIAWLVGLLVAGSVYLALGRSIDLRARVIAGIRDSDLASMAQHIAEIEQ